MRWLERVAAPSPSLPAHAERARMRKVLMVAEKPSIAKQVAAILAGHEATHKRTGPSKYNLNFGFNCMLDGADAPAVMTSVLGHVTTLDFTNEAKNWQGVSMLSLFTAPISRRPSDVRTVLHGARDADPYVCVGYGQCGQEPESRGARNDRPDHLDGL